MTTISSNLQSVEKRIAEACKAAGRLQQSVALLAVSKTFPAAAVREAAGAGQVAFGENYVQEALSKMALLADIPLQWHFIGPLQSNKTRAVAENFAWVHTVDRLKIAERLSAQRPAQRPLLQLCIQVNVSGEASKSGVEPTQAIALAHAVAALPGVQVRGFMAIPAPTDDVTQQHAQFRILAALLQQARAAGLPMDTLSMGMSDDLEAAIAEGSSMVRVGTAIFGARKPAGVESQ